MTENERDLSLRCGQLPAAGLSQRANMQMRRNAQAVFGL